MNRVENESNLCGVVSSPSRQVYGHRYFHTSPKDPSSYTPNIRTQLFSTDGCGVSVRYVPRSGVICTGIFIEGLPYDEKLAEKDFNNSCDAASQWQLERPATSIGYQLAQEYEASWDRPYAMCSLN